MSIVLVGSTSGSVTLQEPAVSGSTVIDLPATSGTMVVTGGAQTVQFAAGSASTPSITFTGDTNTGIFSPGADTIAFTEGGTESMRIDSSGNVGIGTTSLTQKLSVSGGIAATGQFVPSNGATVLGYIGNDNSISGGTGTNLGIRSDTATTFATGGATERMRITSTGTVAIGTTTTPTAKLWVESGRIGLTNLYKLGWHSNPAAADFSNYITGDDSTNYVAIGTGATERMRINSSGNVLIGKSADDATTAGLRFAGTGTGIFTSSGDLQIICNRLTNDGTLILFRQDNADEGSISVSGSTVSYNGGHLSRWSQLPNNQKDDTLLKGTVMSNLDDMCVWVKDGETLPNEQLNKMKVSDVEGDTNVAGVFVNWTFDEQCQSDDINVAMTGDMIIRIADGVVVQKGDLLMSAGDGTAKPQGDDIRRSKTVAKVTSNHVTCTYADGSYCVPCVLMAC